MNIAQDIKAAERFAESLKGIDPAQVVDVVFKFMSSTRGRIEAGEKRVADLEGKLTTVLATVDKLSGILGSMGGVDFSKLQGEIDAMAGAAKVATDTATSVVDKVLAAVPDADPAHVQVAVDAHATATGNGAIPADVSGAAVKAAMGAGASEDTAKAIAAAIPTSSDTPAKPDAATIAAAIPAEAVTAPVVQAAIDAHAAATTSGADAIGAAHEAAFTAAQGAGTPISTADAQAVAQAVNAAATGGAPNVANPEPVATGDVAGAGAGKTILADGTVQ